jgi:hypothetical protein
MRYTKSSTVSGAWVKASEVVSGTKCKLVAETIPSESTYEGKVIKNNSSKIRFQGEEGEAKNVNVNRPSINGLIDAYGEDSKDWIGKVLTAQTEKMLVGGKRVTALYLIPEGFEMKEDENGYIVISKIGVQTEARNSVNGLDYPSEEINAEDIPF